MGAALSTIDLMEMSKKQDGDSYKIKANLMTSLVKNAEYMRLIKERLDNMIYLLDKEYEKERINWFFRRHKMPFFRIVKDFIVVVLECLSNK